MAAMASGAHPPRSLGRVLLLGGALALAGIWAVLHAQRGDEADPPESTLTWQARIAPAGEPGEPLVVSGQVFDPSGEKPAAGVVVYAYHTDAQGYYRRQGQPGPGGRVPRLRGWARSDAQGRFQFRTIRPAPYPNGGIPAHIHFYLWGAGYPRQWTPELEFQGDRSVTAEALAKSAALGRFANIQPLVRGPDGAWHATINFRLLTVSNVR